MDSVRPPACPPRRVADVRYRPRAPASAVRAATARERSAQRVGGTRTTSRHGAPRAGATASHRQPPSLVGRGRGSVENLASPPLNHPCRPTIKCSSGQPAGAFSRTVAPVPHPRWSGRTCTRAARAERENRWLSRFPPPLLQCLRNRPQKSADITAVGQASLPAQTQRRRRRQYNASGSTAAGSGTTADIVSSN